MRILIHDYTGHPFQVQLSRQLAKEGYEVLHVYSASFQTPKGALEKTDEDPVTFNVIGLNVGKKFHKHSYVRRYFQERKYGRLLTKEANRFLPEVVISANTPLEAQKKVLWYSKRNDIGFIYWLQDVYSVAIQKLLGKKIPIFGDLIGQYYMNLERLLLQKSNYIVAITVDFTELLKDWGICEENIAVIPNWAPIDELPVKPKDNAWAHSHGLTDKFVFIYSGTLGLKHNPNILFQLAGRFQNYKDVRVVVISEGRGAEWLRKRMQIQHLDNLIIMDYQDYQVLPDVLSAADVLVAILEPEAGVFSVPSKVLTYLCFGRPLLLAVPRENLAARIVESENAGLAAAPNEAEEFLEAAQTLFEDEEIRDAMGKNAKRYAERVFNINIIAEKFIDLIQRTGMKGTA
ncbi:glycosyltransferase family 4 protein [Candidatus Neomarinimicrobiota bacterium]